MGQSYDVPTVCISPPAVSEYDKHLFGWFPGNIGNRSYNIEAFPCHMMTDSGMII
jgi:hypothetical protein